MEFLVSKLMKCMETEENDWTELERLKMQLGFQVLLHNLFMIGIILIVAKMLGIFTEAVALFIGYGLLKITAGGIHFQKSCACLLSTGVFVIGSVYLLRNIKLSFPVVLLIYLICVVVLWIVGPQGTENNPISEDNFYKLRYRTMLIAGSYLLITIFMFAAGKRLPYFLLVATVFETISILPEKMKNRYCA